MRLLVRTSLLLVTALAVVAGPAAAADLERGEQLYALCTQCHGAQGVGNSDALAPAIGGMAEWHVLAQLDKFRQGMRGMHFDDIAGMRMRPMSRWLETDEDVAAVAAYVATLPPAHPERELEGGDPAAGKALYTPCIACHAVDGSGNQALGGSPLKNQSDWYLYKQIENFKQGIRGWHPQDTGGSLMRAMASTLSTDEQMKNVIAHILTLSK